jgi:hypothetical protein
VVEAAADVAMKVTGAMNYQEAAAVLKNNPEAAANYKAAVAENFDQWMGMMVKFSEIDEKSKAAAREFVSQYDRMPVVFNFTFIEFLSTLMVIAAICGGTFVLWDPLSKFTNEMRTAVIMLMFIGGWNGVKEFWLGSSMGSMRKTELASQKEAP